MTEQLIPNLPIFQVQIRRVQAIFTVWNVITTVRTQIRWWLIEDNIKNWTVLWLRVSRNTPPHSTVRPQDAPTMENKRITIAENANTLFLVCRKWKHTNIGIWMNRVDQARKLASTEWTEWSYPRIEPGNTASGSNNGGKLFTECMESQKTRWGQNSI